MAVKQHKIDAPGINPDAVDQNAVVANFVQAGADFRLQAVNVPGLDAVLLLQAVTEAMDFTKRKCALCRRIAGKHHAPAGCT
ncbi:hypothetical protein D3C80_1700750 [compost metagenome]